MDQLRKALTWLKQQHFWVLTVLIVLIALYCRWSGARTLSTEYAKNEATIKSGFTALDSVTNEPFHPNDNIQKKQQEETNKQADNVKSIWQRLYERQREKVLTWPDALGPEFIAHVEKLEFGDESIEPEFREVYQNYIMNHFRKLPDSIDARAISETEMGNAGGGQYRGGPAGPEGGASVSPAQLAAEDDNYICEWDPADQAIVRNDLVFEQQPSPLRIWVTQENLWVYQALLDVIHNTNAAAKATRKSNAAVRIVHSLEVGQRAAPHSRTPNRIYQVPIAAAATSPDGFSEQPAVSPEGLASAAGPPVFNPQQFADPSGAPLSREQELAMLLNWRYLDPEGKPMGSAATTGAENPDAAAPATPVDLEALKKGGFKQLPVRMVLQMDLRYLPQLIGQCANQSLQVEVKEVRILKADPNNPGAGLAGMGPGEGFGGGPGGNSPMSSTGPQVFDTTPHIATVIVQGVIYIFNPPNETLLETTTSADGSETI